ncbi:P-loop containing nucleoside triphosphate hydrolase protein [Chytriomyces sp. MP71]|nr:P-loop containing nucleoside triphosphate hydrolase protein [Chytriomyces sp. MP71]
MGYGFTLCVYISICVIIPGLMRHISRWLSPKLGAYLRIGFVSVIYKKCMRLSISHTSSTGYIVNLIANDLNRFDEASVFFLFMFLGPIFLVITTGLIYLQIGSAAFVASGVTLLLIPIQSVISRQFGAFRRATVAPRDSRLKFISDMLNGIMMVKLYAWEEPLLENIDKLRQEEIKMMRKAAMLRAINLSLYQTFSCVSELFAFGTFYLMGGTLTPSKVFTTVALLQSLRWNMGLRFPSSLQFSTESMVSFRRIQAFLLLPEIDDTVRETTELPSDAAPSAIIHMTDCSLGWAESPLATVTGKSVPEKLESVVRPILKDVNLSVREKELVVVVGPVGAGKSSLLNAILREMHFISGNMYRRPNLRVAYASQTPWILSGTIAENILFGSSFDETKMRDVIKACALERDLQLFENGLNTVVGERGITLSGGQKARVALARACYSDADLVLLDDPLSAVDARVGKQIFNDCINGFLRDKARVLVTHQLQYVTSADSVVLLENGSIMAQGSYEIVQKTETSFSKIMADFFTRDAFADAEIHEEEDVGASTDTLKALVRKEQVLKSQGTGPAQPTVFIKEEAAKGSVSLAVYSSYFRAGASTLLIVLVISAFIGGQVLLIVTDWWMGQWAAQSASNQSMPIWGGMFLGFVLITVTVIVIRSLVFLVVCLRSSLNLSEKAVRSVFAAEMRFFIENPAGRIINRFSSDLNRVDESLPWVLFDFVTSAISSLATFILACYFLPVVLVSAPFLGFTFWFLRRRYVAASRQIKREEAITRSPVYATIPATLEGLSTVRAYGAESRFLKTLVDFQNDNTRLTMLYLAIGKWLGMRLDLVSALFTVVVVFTAVAISNVRSLQISASNLGLVLTYSLNLVGVMQWAFRQSAETENLMTSAERVLEYTSLPPEKEPLIPTKPPKEWPDRGEIRIQNLFLNYPPSQKKVLKDINVVVPAGATVGIVGRTGSGKSSLLQALFRLVTPEGNVQIDGIDTSTLNLSTLRSCMSIIPQDPFCFRGSLRYNLDPTGQHTDSELWTAIDHAQLRDMVEALPDKLDSFVSENGGNLSVGERQLLCLARAVLKRSKIFVMDEATSAVDMNTDALIAKVLRDKGGVFHGVTTLTIAHRLNTIIDYDYVMVLDDGRLVEFGEPAQLLEKDLKEGDAYFARLVRETGEDSRNLLIKQARAHYNETNL